MRKWNVGTIGVGCAVLLASVSALMRGLTMGQVIMSLHMDGVFQTSSMLYRLAAGELPGRDFLPYLGAGPMMALYPGFVLLGKTVAASTSTATMMCLLLEALGVAMIVALTLDEHRYKRLLAIFAGVLSLLSISLTKFGDLGPGNSLRPLRASLPYVLIAVLLLVGRHVERVWLRYLLFGITAGTALIWSNDFGFPTCAVALTLACYEAWHRKELSVINLLLIAAGTALAGTVLMLAVTAGHPLDLLRYNFKDVAGDQFWFFGNDPRSAKIILPADLTIIQWQIAGILTASIVLLLLPRRRYVYLVALGWAAFLGGFLAIVGGHFAEGYVLPFNGWFALTTILVLASRLPVSMGKMRSLLTPGRVRFLYGALVLGCLAVTTREHFKTIAFMKREQIEVKELGGYMFSDQKDVVAFARSAKEPLLEEYWGLTSAIRRTHGPWRVDLAIGALGSQRVDAEKKLAAWDGVVTTTKLGSIFSDGWLHEYQSWAVNENWWLYRPVLQDYEPFLFTPNLIYWKKSATPKVWPETPCSVTNDPKPRVTIDGEDGYYDLTVDYVFNSRRWHANLMQQTNTAIFHRDNYGYISVDTRATQSRKPVYISKRLPPGLEFMVFPKSQEKALVLKGCTARKIVGYPPGILSRTTIEGFADNGTRGDGYRIAPD